MRRQLRKRLLSPAFWIGVLGLLALPFGASAKSLVAGVPNELLLAGVLGITIFVLLVVFLIIGYMFYQNLNFILHFKPKPTNATR